MKPFNLAAGAQVRNFQNRRGWALPAAAAPSPTFTGPDFTDFGCGPAGAIDGSQGSGWGEHPGRPRSTITLPAAVNVTDIRGRPERDLR